MVGDGRSSLTKGNRLGTKVLHLYSPIQQAVLCMSMQMDKIGHTIECRKLVNFSPFKDGVILGERFKRTACAEHKVRLKRGIIKDGGP